jgi:hypothetical protein
MYHSAFMLTRKIIKNLINGYFRPKNGRHTETVVELPAEGGGSPGNCSLRQRRGSNPQVCAGIFKQSMGG